MTACMGNFLELEKFQMDLVLCTLLSLVFGILSKPLEHTLMRFSIPYSWLTKIFLPGKKIGSQCFTTTLYMRKVV